MAESGFTVKLHKNVMGMDAFIFDVKGISGGKITPVTFLAYFEKFMKLLGMNE